MIMRGIVLMFVGMGTVIVFLWLMVLVMHATALFFKRFAHLFPEKTPAVSHLNRITPDESVLVAIAIAAVKRLQD
jgi:Na+-transporting methylmalonyl-CoA/oxaloacetate decarboxylase gamma subunit